jgi:hypothetical protein
LSDSLTREAERKMDKKSVVLVAVEGSRAMQVLTFLRAVEPDGSKLGNNVQFGPFDRLPLDGSNYHFVRLSVGSIYGKPATLWLLPTAIGSGEPLGMPRREEGVELIALVDSTWQKRMWGAMSASRAQRECPWALKASQIISVRSSNDEYTRKHPRKFDPRRVAQNLVPLLFDPDTPEPTRPKTKPRGRRLGMFGFGVEPSGSVVSF